ncbi:MAG: undecaprenyldiphospho-muramoylpentapeptide beta-N-acetylglucosaminyltransferase [Alphaproteobacteria bacterium]
MMKIVITTGGTGGHIFPAVATAKCLLKNKCEVSLLTDARGTKWSDKKIPLYNVPSAKVLGRGIIGKLSAGFKILGGVFVAIKHLNKIKPDGIVGFGGYASFPVVLAGRILGIPIILHEQNAYAGSANRVLSRFAKIVATAFPNTKALKAKTVHTGNPVRQDIKKLYKNKYPSVDKKINILITGGSQGAEIFGDVIPKALTKYKDKIKVVQQVRKEQLTTVKNFYKKHKINADVRTFIDDMPKVLKQSHIAICRSGAGSVMENACVGLPAIYVPYKYSANNHQYYNAKSIADVGGGIIINQDDFTEESLQKAIDSIIIKNKLNKMSVSAKSFAIYDADERLAKTILKVIKK